MYEKSSMISKYMYSKQVEIIYSIRTTSHIAETRIYYFSPFVKQHAPNTRTKITSKTNKITHKKENNIVTIVVSVVSSLLKHF